MRHRYWLGVIGSIVIAAPAAAGSDPLYEPAPGWVAVAPLPDANAPAFAILDMQQRVEDGRLWFYVDAATRILSPEMLSQAATLTLPWAPDKGDLIVHELSILRDGEAIDLIAQGQKFTVLRREQSLEQLELTGVLTATLAIEGLRVGDLLRLRASTTSKDDALAGRVQSVVPIIAAPAQIGFARLRYSWPTGAEPRWKIYAQNVAAKPERKGGYTELSLSLPIAKQPDMPGDAPQRFLHPPMMVLSSFTDWADVSKVMAPLYETQGTIAPDGPIAAEVAAIMKAETTAAGRAQRALELVQDKIRYLAVGMDGGNYIPQSPDRTWQVRYGDCKAKTLLLLAMLHAMDIEAEPVLAHTVLGDFVPENLPSALAFNHVLVRASIDGESLWLDGTGAGSRLPDIRDTPPFRHVLPVRAAGAGLMEIPMRANARPSVDLTIDADESASSDLPTVFDATAVIRGAPAAMLTLASSQLGEKERREVAASFFQEFLGEAQFSTATIKPDSAEGTVVLSARGVANTPWFSDERKRKRSLSRTLEGIDFAPDRARPSWKDIPVAAPDPDGVRLKLRVRLPDSGRGYSIEGKPELRADLAGYSVSWKAHLAEGVATIEEQIDAVGGEIPAARIGLERDKLATAKAQSPRIAGPFDMHRRWDLQGRDPAGATQIKAIEATFAQAIANDPEEASGYISRASFRGGIGDRRGALGDISRAIAIEPAADLYLRRARLHHELGNMKAAAADAEAARQLDPSSPDAISQVAWLKAEQGDLRGAIALLDERIALGGDMRSSFSETKAGLIGEFGDAAEALTLFDSIIADKPGSPSLLNGRCWLKGTRSLMLETALKDCTEAIELSTNSTQALDSRAMVWYRLGRYEEALRDLDAVLAKSPAHPASRFLRGAILAQLDRRAEASKDIQLARHLSPRIDADYARYGIKIDRLD